MRARLLIVAVSGLSLATAAVAAEPAKAPVRTADQPTDQAVPVVVAAANEVRTPAAAEQNAAPAKRERKARVTTCRCGDQTPNE